MTSWQTERSFREGGFHIEVRREPGAYGARVVTARRGNDAYFERVEWNVWAGHCHGQLWLPDFIARAIQQAAVLPIRR